MWNFAFAPFLFAPLFPLVALAVMCGSAIESMRPPPPPNDPPVEREPPPAHAKPRLVKR